jgi:hypothetical protein
MSSAGSFRLQRTWDLGETSQRQFDLGPRPDNGSESPTPLGMVRLSYGTTQQVGTLRADIRLGDDGTVLEGIDLPCAIVCEIPVTVILKPIAPCPIAVQANCVVSPVLGQIDTYAKRVEVLTLNTVIDLPQWVRSVTCLEPAELVFLDRAAVALNSSDTGFQLKPATALQLRASVAGTFILSY